MGNRKKDKAYLNHLILKGGVLILGAVGLIVLSLSVLINESHQRKRSVNINQVNLSPGLASSSVFPIKRIGNKLI